VPPVGFAAELVGALPPAVAPVSTAAGLPAEPPPAVAEGVACADPVVEALSPSPPSASSLPQPAIAKATHERTAVINLALPKTIHPPIRFKAAALRDAATFGSTRTHRHTELPLSAARMPPEPLAIALRSRPSVRADVDHDRRRCALYRALVLTGIAPKRPTSCQDSDLSDGDRS